jgi:DNA-directed RNA polymerase subunit RPC12/RpoP
LSHTPPTQPQPSSRDQTRDAHTTSHKEPQRNPGTITPGHANIQTSNHTKPPHPSTRARAYRCGYKMLASTIQISNNNPTPETDHTHRCASSSRVLLKPRHPSPKGGKRPDSSEPQQCAPTPSPPETWRARPLRAGTDP